jgi:hypothetical protein
MTTLQKLGVNVVLGERVMTWPEDPEHLNEKTKVLTTDKGREFHADLVVSFLYLFIWMKLTVSSHVQVKSPIHHSWPPFAPLQSHQQQTK